MDFQSAANSVLTACLTPGAHFTQGGYLVFGVRNEPREVVGMENDQFFTLDPTITTNTLNEHFEPALAWKHHDIEMGGKKIGLIYVGEAIHKPVICRRNKDRDLREGAIYYRYQGRTQEIRTAELRAIMDAERKKIHDQWLHALSKIATVGVSQIGILDLSTGEVSGAKGSFYISEELLPKLQFIQEGRFVESGGDPALKLIGDLQPVGAAAVNALHIVQVPTAISGVDLIRNFLEQRNVPEPMQWVRAICNEQSANYPVHFFIMQAGKTVEQAIAEIREVIVRGKVKERLLKALKDGRQDKRPKLDGDSEKAVIRRDMFDRLRAGTLTHDDVKKNFDRVMEAVLHLDREYGDRAFVAELLNEVLKTYGNLSGNRATRFRSAVCHLDQEWYGPRAGEVPIAIPESG